MNFDDLKQILEKIRNGIPCRECKTHFENQHIRIIGTLLNEGYFMALCPQCANRMLISVSLQSQQRVHRPITQVRNISPNDVLDMRNFLKNFDGDFINLFSKKA